MSKERKNRLAIIFEKFAERSEWHHKPEGSEPLRANMWSLGIPVNKKLIHAHYMFHSNENSYDFGAPLASIDDSIRQQVSVNILNSEATRGITERIIDDRFYILGSRDGLKNRSEAEIESLLKNDVYRIKQHFEMLEKILNEN